MWNYEYLSQLLVRRKALLSISKNADPASGISFMIRRGVARDNEDVEDDDVKRPWVVVESSLDFEKAQDALDLLIQTNMDSIKLFRNSVRNDMEKAELVLRDADEILKSIPDVSA
jgi:hypothetical protein